MSVPTPSPATDTAAVAGDTTSPRVTAADMRGWTVGKVRRARLFIAALALAGVVAVWATLQPWYGFATAGVPDCGTGAAVSGTVAAQTPITQTVVPDVAAAACASGWDLGSHYSTPVPTDRAMRTAYLSLSNRVHMAQPDVVALPGGGVPTSVVWLGGALGVAVAGLLLRNGFVGAAALGLAYQAHQELAGFQKAMTAGPGGMLNHPQSGMEMYSLALLAAAAVAFTAFVFVVQTNREQRRIDKAHALAAGDPEPLDWLDKLAVQGGSRAARVIQAVKEQSADKKPSSG